FNNPTVLISPNAPLDLPDQQIGVLRNVIRAFPPSSRPIGPKRVQLVDDSAPNAVGRLPFPSTPAVVAAFQISSPSLPSPFPFPYAGPYSLSVLEERIADFKSSVQQSLSHLQFEKSPGYWEGEQHRQCSVSRENQSFQSRNQNPMSQKPAGSGLQQSPYNGGFPYSARDTPKLPPMGSGTKLSSPKGGEHGGDAVAGSPVSTTSSRTLLTSAPPSEMESSATRPLRMHNILNPPNLATEMLRQRVVSQAETPPTVNAALSQYSSEPSPESSSRGATPGTTLPPMNLYSSSIGHSTRLMTPSSLARGGLNATGVNAPSGTIDAKVSPFLPVGSQAYNHNAPPVTHSVPPLGNTPPIAPRPSYGFPIQQANTPPDRRPGDPMSQAPPSQSNSPATSYSSYSHPSHPSPAPQYTTPTTQGPKSMYFSSHGSAGGRASVGPQITLGTDSSYGPSTSAVGQSTYQLMTLDTDQGPIQVPVDVQAASKMADEKRKRNAGASARFRQRRKEKEREASTTITKLESQIRDLSEERDYYRVERDYFRGIVYSTSAQALVVPRVPSPRLRKSSQSSGGAPRSEAQWEQSEDRGAQTGRNTRRRINSFTPTYELPPPGMAPPIQSPAYPNAPPSFTFPKTEPRAHTPLQRASVLSGPHGLGPFDPAGHPPYERAWTTSQ
ncbi:hypothetical protein MMC11_007874, partial [Xylographa trunciseda]|nr:hypothetical protein [Xylographa trunciseda]